MELVHNMRGLTNLRHLSLAKQPGHTKKAIVARPLPPSFNLVGWVVSELQLKSLDVSHTDIDAYQVRSASFSLDQFQPNCIQTLCHTDS